MSQIDYKGVDKDQKNREIVNLDLLLERGKAFHDALDKFVKWKNFSASNQSEHSNLIIRLA